MAPSEHEEDSDVEDEELKAEGKLKIIIDYNGDSTAFVVKQSTLASKVRAGAAKKYSLDPKLITILSKTEGIRLDVEKTMKVNGLEAGRTYRFDILSVQQGGGHVPQ